MAPIPTSIQEATRSISSRATSYLSTTTKRLVWTWSSPSTTSQLDKRQNVVVVPTTYSIPASNPTPGTVAGIVLGVVGGICFVLWIMYIVFNLNGAEVSEVEVIKTKPVRRSRREARSEVIEVSRTRVRSEPRRVRETTIIEERRAPRMEEEEDIVEVIEEHSPPRRSRRSSGYRNVDPNEFAGGRRDRRGVR